MDEEQPIWIVLTFDCSEPSKGSGFNNALGRLRTLELVQGRGEIKALKNHPAAKREIQQDPKAFFCQHGNRGKTSP